MELKFKVGDRVSVKENVSNNNPQFTGVVLSMTGGLHVYWGPVYDVEVDDPKRIPGNWLCWETDMTLLEHKPVVDQITKGVEQAREAGLNVEMPDHAVFTSPTGEQEMVNLRTNHPLRRVKALATNRDMLLSLLMAPAKEGVTRFNLAVVDASSLPADVQVEDVTYDAVRQLFLIEITSEAFEPVKLGESIPIIDLPVDNWSVTRIRDDQMVVPMPLGIDKTLPSDGSWTWVHKDQCVISRSAAETGLAALRSFQESEKAKPRDLWASNAMPADQATELIEIRKLLTTLVEQGYQSAERQRTVGAEQSGTLEQIAKLMIREVHCTEEAMDITRKFLAKPISTDYRGLDTLEAWNRTMGIIKPTEIIVERKDIEELASLAKYYFTVFGEKREFKLGRIIEITDRLLSTPDELHRKSAKDAVGAQHTPQP